uniref:TAFA chemokine like family member 5 n=1 Tax=Bos indicus x Bos taurus TaxID=30522 RepID=A0A4W2FBH5_BOBOX
MAPSPRTGSRQDATALPSMSSTFWAFMILASLLIAYCSQLAAGTCEIVTLDRDSSQPRRTIARQTARCACRKGQIAGTTRARPACVDGKSPGPPGAGPRPSRTFLPGPLFAGWNLQQAPWAACRSGAWGTVVPTWPEDVPWPVRLLWAEWSEVLP